MNVQDPASEVFNKPRTQNTHESCEDQQVRIESIEFSGESAIERFSIGEVGVTKTPCFNVGLGCARESIRIRAIAKNQHDVQIEFTAADLVDERLQIAATT